MRQRPCSRTDNKGVHPGRHSRGVPEMTSTERILGAARLSHSSDVSSSIATQRAGIASVAAYRNATVVHITEDTDISGGMSPFDRPSLGPWLSDPSLIAQWDVICVSKL